MQLRDHSSIPSKHCAASCCYSIASSILLPTIQVLPHVGLLILKSRLRPKHDKHHRQSVSAKPASNPPNFPSVVRKTRRRGCAGPALSAPRAAEQFRGKSSNARSPLPKLSWTSHYAADSGVMLSSAAIKLSHTLSVRWLPIQVPRPRGEVIERGHLDRFAKSSRRCRRRTGGDVMQSTCKAGARQGSWRTAERARHTTRHSAGLRRLEESQRQDARTGFCM